jgi:hypothetical protein
MSADRKRVLVVLDPELGDAVGVRKSLDRDADEIFVVSPLLPSRVGWLTNDDAAPIAAAEERLDGALGEASDAGVEARGAVGSDDDLLTVIGDALAEFPADEVLLATRPGEERHWRFERLVADVGERHSLPVTAFEVPAPAGTTR